MEISFRFCQHEISFFFSESFFYTGYFMNKLLCRFAFFLFSFLLLLSYFSFFLFLYCKRFCYVLFSFYFFFIFSNRRDSSQTNFYINFDLVDKTYTHTYIHTHVLVFTKQTTQKRKIMKKTNRRKVTFCPE